MPSLNDQIVEILPHLQRYAWVLTRRRDQADDLVQDCIERAMAKRELFRDGTNLRAWMYAMMRNIFLSGKRREKVSDRHITSLKRDRALSQPPAQFHSLLLARTQAALQTLTEDERVAVMMLAVEQRSYDETAAQSGNPLGTMKSRLSRARAKLRKAVLEEQPAIHLQLIGEPAADAPAGARDAAGTG